MGALCVASGLGQFPGALLDTQLQLVAGSSERRIVSLLPDLHFIEGGNNGSNLVPAVPFDGDALATAPRAVDRLQQTFQRDSDGPPVGDQGTGYDRQQEQSRQRDREHKAAARVSNDLRVVEHDHQAPDRIRSATKDVNDLLFGEECVLLDTLDLSDRGDQNLPVIVDRSGQNIRIDLQGGQDQLDLIVGHIPERLREHRALNGDQLFQLALEFLLRGNAGIVFDKPKYSKN
ncbi:MAG: hypothetical protein O7D91_21055 [Planctomycetota bacterium]|nr:hypothetical protein [Planctomycetota bacterium]